MFTLLSSLAVTVSGPSPGVDKWCHRPLVCGCWSCSCGVAAEAMRGGSRSYAGWDTPLLQSLSLPLLTWLHLLSARHLALPIASAVLPDVRMRWPWPPGWTLLRLHWQRWSNAGTTAWAAATAVHPAAADPAAAADPDPAAAAAVIATAADPACSSGVQLQSIARNSRHLSIQPGHGRRNAARVADITAASLTMDAEE